MGPFKDSLKDSLKKSSLISVAISGFDNYLKSGGINKKFWAGFIVDSASEILIGAGAVTLVAGGVALAGLTLQGWGIAAIAAGVSYFGTKALEKPLDGLKA